MRDYSDHNKRPRLRADGAKFVQIAVGYWLAGLFNVVDSAENRSQTKKEEQKIHVYTLLYPVVIHFTMCLLLLSGK